ncbi:MAG: hypothetical protein ACTSWN_02720, partial [Promethearchaeota archaeon]
DINKKVKDDIQPELEHAENEYNDYEAQMKVFEDIGNEIIERTRKKFDHYRKIKKIERKLEKYNYFENDKSIYNEIGDMLREIEGMKRDLKNKHDKLEDLEKKKIRLEDAEKELSIYSDLQNAEGCIDKIENLNVKMVDSKNFQSDVEKRIKVVDFQETEINAFLEGHADILANLQPIEIENAGLNDELAWDLDRLKKDETLLKLDDKIREVKSKNDRLTKLVEEYKECLNAKTRKEALEKKREKFKDLDQVNKNNAVLENNITQHEKLNEELKKEKERLEDIESAKKQLENVKSRLEVFSRLDDDEKILTECRLEESSYVEEDSLFKEKQEILNEKSREVEKLKQKRKKLIMKSTIDEFRQ